MVNLSPSLAITQNFVPRKHLSSVLSFLRDQPQSISGFDCEKIKDPYALFVKRMMEEYPEILEQGMQELESMCNGNGKKRGKWDELVNGAHNGGETFAFNFLIDDGSDSDEEEEEEGEDYIE